MENLNLSWTTNFLFTSLFTALGVLLWWLVRVKLKSFRLPILRVLDIPPASLPKLRTTPPPFLPFFCFLVAALSLLGLTLKPSSRVIQRAPVDGQRVLVVLDLSPSVSSVVTSLKYQEVFSSFVDALDGKSVLSVVRTNQKQTITGETHQAVKESVGKLEFHSFGTKLGETLKYALAQSDTYTDIVIFSDQDSFSWSDLNWKFLASDRRISRVDLGEGRQRDNVYVKDVMVQSSPDSKILEWVIGLGSSLTSGNQAFNVEVFAGDQKLAAQRASFEGQEAQVTLSWPESKMKAFEGKSLSVRLDSADAVELDNQFQVSKNFSSAAAILVGDPGGEQPLEDPAHSLVSMLQLLAINVDRRDLATTETQKIKRNFVINWLGTHGRDTCQLGNQGIEHNYWLIPETQDSFFEVCQCLQRIETQSSRIASSKGGSSKEMSFGCGDLKSQSEWGSGLVAQGFFQMGGQLGSSSESLALRGRVHGSDVVVFQMPFTPLAGIPHGNWPLLVKAFVDAEQFLKSSGAWPRYNSLFEIEATTDSFSSNVPYLESALQDLSQDELPRTWDWQPNSLSNTYQDPDDSDPLPWIARGIYVVLGAFLVELLFSLYTRFRIGILALLLSGFSLNAEGSLVLSALSPHPLGMGDFAKSLESRTSLSLDSSARVYPKLSTQALREPWLFVNNPAMILGPNGAFLPELEGWIRKGGILVLQADSPIFQLEKFTSEGFVSTVKKGQWRPIAPDHELMRSFYLLDSLPGCEGMSWQEYRYDGRTAIMAIPFKLSTALSDSPEAPSCEALKDKERLTRVLVNLFMVSLATDYKKDQIHLPEILKRLR